MVNLLITGNNGFLSKEFSSYFSKKYNIFNLNKNSLLNLETIISFIKFNKIDFILHTSWSGVGAGNLEDYNYNLKVHTNLELTSSYVKNIFIFGSGAEFKNTDKAKESDLSDLSEGSYYSLAKNVISKRSRLFKQFINLRLFGCFGYEELPTRFIKRSMMNIREGRNIVVNKNKYMDFFYVKDLCYLIETHISNNNLPSELNCVYTEKLTLLEIAEFIRGQFSPETQIELKELGYDMPYTGDSSVIDSLNLNLKGLHYGIREIYGHERKNITTGF